MRNNRYSLPLIFSITGILVTYFFAMGLANIIHNVLTTYDPMPVLPGTAPKDTVSLLRIIIPITILVYVILSIPVAFAYMIGSKFAKIGAYHLGIINTGEKFGTKKILYRSVSPALFALTFGQTILTIIPNAIINEPGTMPQAILPLFAPYFTIIGSLIVLTIALVLYVPTWLLNDSGIVYNLKPQELETRRCPDTMGVGRWISNFLGGYSLFGYPITAFFTHFYKPFVIQGIGMSNLAVVTSVFWTVGLPLMMMAFVLPIVILNELMLKRLVPIIQKLARGLGAKDVQLEILVDA